MMLDTISHKGRRYKKNANISDPVGAPIEARGTPPAIDHGTSGAMTAAEFSSIMASFSLSFSVSAHSCSHSMMVKVWLQATMPATIDVRSTDIYGVVSKARFSVTFFTLQRSPVFLKIPEYAEDIRIISDTFSIEIMPPPFNIAAISALSEKYPQKEHLIISANETLWTKRQMNIADTIPPNMTILTFSLSNASKRRTIAGITAKIDRLKSLSNTVLRLGICPLLFENIPITTYIAQEIKKGIAVVFNILLIFEKMFVFVIVATRSALVETGEHLSPKYAPATMAPPVSKGETPRVCAIVLHITPIVAAVPKAVPVRKDKRQLSKKVISKNIDGEINFVDIETMTGIVPDVRQRAVMIPIRTNVKSMFLTVFIPEKVILKISFTEKPFFKA